MKKLLVLTLASILFLSCSNKDAQLKKDIVGKWEGYMTVHENLSDIHPKLKNPILEFSATDFTSIDYTGKEIPYKYSIKNGNLYLECDKRRTKKLVIKNNTMIWDEDGRLGNIHFEFRRVE